MSEDGQLLLLFIVLTYIFWKIAFWISDNTKHEGFLNLVFVFLGLSGIFLIMSLISLYAVLNGIPIDQVVNNISNLGNWGN